jgi:hypothetical protein
MKKLALILPLVLLLSLLVLPSCLTSLHPLYTEKTLVQRKELNANRWKDKEGVTWTFKKRDQSKLYDLVCQKQNNYMEFEAGLVKLGDHHFLDLQNQGAPYQMLNGKKIEGPEAPTLLALNIEGHNFYRIAFKDKKLQVMSFDDTYLKTLFKQRKVRIKHEVLGEGSSTDMTVLTASSSELQQFMLKYGGDDKLFNTEETLYLTALTK